MTTAEVREELIRCDEAFRAYWAINTTTPLDIRDHFHQTWGALCARYGVMPFAEHELIMKKYREAIMGDIQTQRLYDQERALFNDKPGTVGAAGSGAVHAANPPVKEPRPGQPSPGPQHPVDPSKPYDPNRPQTPPTQTPPAPAPPKPPDTGTETPEPHKE